MSASNIGAIIDNLVYLVIGVWLIYLSVKQKEKLGNKVTITRLGGIIAIIAGIIGLIFIFLKK